MLTMTICVVQLERPGSKQVTVRSGGEERGDEGEFKLVICLCVTAPLVTDIILHSHMPNGKTGHSEDHRHIEFLFADGTGTWT